MTKIQLRKINIINFLIVFIYNGIKIYCHCFMIFINIFKNENYKTLNNIPIIISYNYASISKVK